MKTKYIIKLCNDNLNICSDNNYVDTCTCIIEGQRKSADEIAKRMNNNQSNLIQIEIPMADINNFIIKSKITNEWKDVIKEISLEKGEINRFINNDEPPKNRWFENKKYPVI